MGIFSLSKDEKAQLKAIDEHYAVIEFKPDGTILKANTNFLNIMGYSSSEIVGKHHKIFCDEKFINSKEYSNFWNDLNKGFFQSSEFKRIKKDGHSIFIQASYKPLKDSNGNIYKIVKYAQDITERKTKNLYYLGQIEAINKSQAIIEFNMDGTVIKANENFLNTFGYTLSEIVGKHHSLFCEESYKNSSEYTKFWEKLNRGEYDGGEYLRVGKNNEKIWIQATYNPILDIDNQPMMVIKYATNITNKKNMIFEIDENVHKLTNSLEKLSTASSSMTNRADVTMKGSHEVSTSINEIKESMSDINSKIENLLSSTTAISESTQKGERIALEAQNQSKSTTDSMLKLDQESEKIGETINIISQIAFQTNILSLNAAVEAATAGEAGKGFAVVAQEVRNLATRSNEAAKEITNAVEHIQSLIKNSLDSINSIDKTIADMAKMSTDISNSMTEQKSISNDVSNITSETNNEINEITYTMSNVSQSAENTKIEAEETQNASDELAKVSSELISILKVLK